MTYFVPVAGTHGFDGTFHGTEWWEPTSPLQTYLRPLGLVHARPDRPFVWCTGLDGVLGNDRHWIAAGEQLGIYLETLPEDARNVVAHSHARAVALVAARRTRIRRLLTVCSPVRADVERPTGQIGWWRHVYSKGEFDLWQTFGTLGDGRIGFYQQDPAADENEGIPDADHSRVLEHQDYFHWWVDARWIDLLGAADRELRRERV